MKLTVFAAIPGLVVLTGCNNDNLDASTDASSTPTDSADNRLEAIAERINQGAPIQEELAGLDPIERGKAFDLLADIRGRSDDGFYVSVEQVERLSAQFFGVTFAELDDVNKDFVVAQVYGDSYYYRFSEEFISEDGVVEAANHKKRRWVLKMVKKVLGRSAAKQLGRYLRDCEIPRGFFWWVVDKVPVVGWALVPCIVR